MGVSVARKRSDRLMDSNLRQASKPDTIRLFFLWSFATAVALLLLSVSPTWVVEDPVRILSVWLLFIISALSAVVLLYSSSKSMKVLKYSIVGVTFVFMFVFGFHIFIVTWLGEVSPLSFFVINPQPMAWFLLSVVTIYVSAALVSIGFPYVSLNQILARLGRPPLRRQTSRHFPVAGFLVNLWESALACFWIIYLWGVYNLETGQFFVQNWDLWTGWPIAPVALALLFCISFLAFAEILGISHAFAIVSVKRYSRNWTLSVPTLLAFVVTVYALLRANPHEYLALLWFVIAFASALSLGFSLSLEALREWGFRRAHHGHWYYSLELDR